MADSDQIQSRVETQLPPPRRRQELLVFMLLAALIWPFITIAFVGSYGFLIWMWQIAFGPPGPPV